MNQADGSSNIAETALLFGIWIIFITTVIVVLSKLYKIKVISSEHCFSRPIDFGCG